MSDVVRLGPSVSVLLHMSAFNPSHLTGEHEVLTTQLPESASFFFLS